MSVIRDSNVYVEGKGIVRTSLKIENGIIKEISDDIDDEDSITLPEKLILSPGFIDEHTHGANGADAMDCKEESLKKIAESILMEGTTSFLYTTMTMTKERILSALNTICDYLPKQGKRCSQAFGVHLDDGDLMKDATNK